MLRWLFKPNRTLIFADHYAVNQDSLDRSIFLAARTQAEVGDLVFLLAHFPSTFEQTQELLEESQLDYGVLTRPIDLSQNVASIRGELKSINLGLVETFMQSSSNSETKLDNNFNISIIVVERHPLLSTDFDLQKKFREIPHSIKAGYYLSFDQPVLKYSVDAGLTVLMRQFGMQNHSLVTSELINRRIASKLKRYERTGQDWKTAKSPQEWYQLNPEPAKISSSNPGRNENGGNP